MTLKTPTDDVVEWFETPVALLTTVTVTPGITAPDASVIVPATPFSTWAFSWPPENRKAANAARTATPLQLTTLLYKELNLCLTVSSSIIFRACITSLFAVLLLGYLNQT